MAGPWEQYQETIAGPWSQYAAAPNADYSIGDVGMAAVRGIPIAGGLVERMSSPESQEQYKSFDKAHPYISGAAGFAGGAAALAPIALGSVATGGVGPALLGMTGATLGRQMVNSALSGAAISGLDAVVRPGSDVGTSTGIGAGFGLAGPVAGRAIGAVAAPVVNTLRGIKDPAGVASRNVAETIARDTRAGRAGMTDAEFQAAQAAGLPVTNMDRGGELTRALGRSAANTSPEGRASLDNMINPRFEAQAARVNQHLDNSFNFPNAEAQSRAIADSVANEINPAYKKAFADSAMRNPRGLWDEGFEQMMQSPSVQDAVRKSIILGTEGAAKEGFTPAKNLFSMDPSGRMTRSPEAAKNGFAPTLEFWNDVKKNLDKVGSFEARDWSRILRSRLDDLVPSYASARAARFSMFQAENALDAGKSFATSKLNNAEVRTAVGKMTEQEKKLFQDGYVSQLKAVINEQGDRRSVLNRIANSPAERERAMIAMGPEKSARFFEMLRHEATMDKARPAVQGNSTTARQLTELGLAGGAYGLGTGFDLSNPNPTAIGSAALLYGLAKGRGAINQNVSKQVADLLASNRAIPMLGGAPSPAFLQNAATLGSRVLPPAF